MKKNHELFWILEVLLLTPIAFFWLGVVSMMLSGSETLLNAVIGAPMSTLKAVFVTMICPMASAWFAFDYLKENQSEKNNTTQKAARMIIVISLLTIALVLVYLYGESR